MGHSYSAMRQRRTDGRELRSPGGQCVNHVDVEAGWMDYTVVETAFFDRKCEDGKESCISRRKHTIVSVRRVKNRKLFRQFEALCQDM